MSVVFPDPLYRQPDVSVWQGREEEGEVVQRTQEASHYGDGDRAHGKARLVKEKILSVPSAMNIQLSN